MDQIKSTKQITDPLSLTKVNTIDNTLIDKADVLQKNGGLTYPSHLS